MTILRNLLKELSEIGQEGYNKLDAFEDAFALIPASPEKDVAQVLLTEFHNFGAGAYHKMGLKLRAHESFTGAPGEVQLKVGGSGGKDSGEG